MPSKPSRETVKHNRQHITQSSRRFAPLLFSVEVNWGSIFTTPTPPGGAPPWVPVVLVPPARSACRSARLRQHVPARSTVCRLPSAVCRLPSAVTSHSHQPQSPATVTSHSHQPQSARHYTTSRLLCRGPAQTVTSRSKLPAKMRGRTPGKKEDEKPRARPNII